MTSKPKDKVRSVCRQVGNMALNLTYPQSNQKRVGNYNEAWKKVNRLEIELFALEAAEAASVTAPSLSSAKADKHASPMPLSHETALKIEGKKAELERAYAELTAATTQLGQLAKPHLQR